MARATRRRPASRVRRRGGLGKLYRGDKCLAFKKVRDKNGKLVKRCKDFATKKTEKPRAAKSKRGVACKQIRGSGKCFRVCWNKKGQPVRVQKCRTTKRKTAKRRTSRRRR